MSRMQPRGPVFPKVVAAFGVLVLFTGSVLVFVAPRPMGDTKIVESSPEPTTHQSVFPRPDTVIPEYTPKKESSEIPKPKAAPSPSPTSSPSAVQPSRRDDPSPRSSSPSPVKPKPTTAKPTPTPTPKPAPTTVKPTPTPMQTVSPPANTTLRAQVIFLINQKRAQAGLSQLAANSHLSDKSQAWSVHMAETRTLVHSSPPPNTLWGEIIASGYTTAESVVEGWMNSPGHRARILDPSYTICGSGYVNGYWTVQFG